MTKGIQKLCKLNKNKPQNKFPQINEQFCGNVEKMVNRKYHRSATCSRILNVPNGNDRCVNKLKQ
jgi:hypothetical protein